MVPGVAAEQHALAGLDDADLAVLRVGDDERAVRARVEDVGGEDGLVRGAVPEPATGCQLELQHVQRGRRHVDAVRHVTGLGVPPDVMGGVAAPDARSARRTWDAGSTRRADAGALELPAWPDATSNTNWYASPEFCRSDRGGRARVAAQTLRARPEDGHLLLGRQPAAEAVAVATVGDPAGDDESPVGVVGPRVGHEQRRPDARREQLGRAARRRAGPRPSSRPRPGCARRPARAEYSDATSQSSPGRAGSRATGTSVKSSATGRSSSVRRRSSAKSSAPGRSRSPRPR